MVHHLFRPLQEFQGPYSRTSYVGVGLVRWPSEPIRNLPYIERVREYWPSKLRACNLHSASLISPLTIKPEHTLSFPSG